MINDDVAGNTIGALETSFRIIEYLRTNGKSRLTPISDELDIPKSTLHTHLNTLRKHDFVVKSGPEYELGLRFMWFGEHAKTKKREYDIVEQSVEKIADETGERTLFIVEEHTSLFYLRVELGENAVDFGPQIGDYGRDFHATSSGKAILAFMSSEKREQILDSIDLPVCTDRTITSREELLSELDEVREREYAINKGEFFEGLYGISVPIHYPDGGLLGSLTVSGPEQRMKGDKLASDLPEFLLGVANEIELNLSRELQ